MQLFPRKKYSGVLICQEKSTPRSTYVLVNKLQITIVHNKIMGSIGVFRTKELLYEPNSTVFHTLAYQKFYETLEKNDGFGK